MNLRAVGWLLGCVLLLMAAFMLVPAAVSAWYGEREPFEGCMWSAVVCAALGGIPTVAWRTAAVKSEGRVDFFRREGLAAVGLAWLVGCAAGGLPFLFSGVMSSPVDAFFESTSGFTTTGSTILGGRVLDDLPMGIAFWRAFSHWLGGIGIVLVFVVLFPAGGRSLFRSEVPGISREAVQHRVRDSALGLVRAYVGLTLAEIVLLWLAGMRSFEHPLFECVVHSFATIATGGFSSHSTSVAFFGSWKVELVIVVFMFASGINFFVYDTFLRHGVRRAWLVASRSTEVRLYTALGLGATAAIALVLWFWGGSNGDPASALPDYSRLGQCLRDSLFSVVSMQSCTGFATADFDRWPDFCRLLVIVVMAFGACAGSTGGGIKVIRLVILARTALAGIQRFSRPRAIHSVRADGESVDDATVGMVMAYCGLWFLVFLIGTLMLSGMGMHPAGANQSQVLITAASGVIASLNNAGPGLGALGPSCDYSFLPDAGKLLLSFLMILGRLEFYAVVVLFVPRFWRH